MDSVPTPPALVAPARQESNEVRDVAPKVRGAWLLLQLVPSPGVAVGDGQLSAAFSWQITPLLYSWAMDPRLVPFRSFVVEPIVRQSGSFEIHFSPSYIGRFAFENNFGFRSGIRAYFPLTERGDGLSFSLGTSVAYSFDRVSPSFDVGVYTLFGGIGLLFAANPWLENARFEALLRLRYF